MRKVKLIIASGIVLITVGVVGSIYTNSYYNSINLDATNAQPYKNNSNREVRGRRYFNEYGRDQLRNHCFFYDLEE